MTTTKGGIVSAKTNNKPSTGVKNMQDLILSMKPQIEKAVF